MIKIKHLTVKNFYSVGSITQSINFNQDQLTLVLGENLDQGGNDSGSRNGTGKSVIIQALSYALFGQAITNIKKDNLINRVNNKNMVVTLTFSKDDIDYRIERGRKPKFVRFFIDNKEQDVEMDEAQGDCRETQKTIDSLLGMNHLMFKHIIALNTYTEPFLSMKVGDQREVIENLLGITVLTEKADVLKENIRDTKSEIALETARIDATIQSNNKILTSIDVLKARQSEWLAKRDETCLSLYNQIENLRTIDIDQEIKNHELLEQYIKDLSNLVSLKKDQQRLNDLLNKQEKLYHKLVHDQQSLINLGVCPQCEQNLPDHKHVDLLESTNAALGQCEQEMSETATELIGIMDQIDAIVPGDKPVVVYQKLSDALSHQNNLIVLENNLIDKAESADPYQEQIDTLTNTALQEISYDSMNEMTKLKTHQEFLLKLLTNKDSFIRKSIIDQNLSYLNNRLSHYLDRIGLIHRVVFQNDLSVEITYLGHSLDFHNLSRGEMTRVTLSLSWAFRDMWENLYQSINLMFIDELIDNGLDQAGSDSALSIMQAMVYDRKKNIFLISHRDELTTKVNNVLKVVKENGFTSYHYD